MKYCIKCGAEVSDIMNYCPECGAEINTKKNSNEKRHQEYAGKIIKCPNCGEVLNSFVSNCPTCGYELRGTSVSDSIKIFSDKISRTSNPEMQIMLIKNFPIPNTKEDIFEFMILASTNLDVTESKPVYDAWLIKFNQCYQKAEVIFGDAPEFNKIQSIYDKKIQGIKKRQKDSLFSNAVSSLPQLIISIAWIFSLIVLIPLCQKNLDSVGTNASQLIYMLDLLVGAIIIPPLLRCASVLPKLAVTIGLLATIFILIPLCQVNLDSAGSNANQLLLIVEFICCVIILIRMRPRKKKS